jgi:hypothetical protein
MSQKVPFVLSPDSTIDLTDMFLGDRRMPKPPPGACVTKTKNVRIGADVAAGDYFLGLIVDSLKARFVPPRKTLALG